MQGWDDRCTHVLIGLGWGRQISKNAHICTLPHIALDPAQDIHVSISPTMDISSHLELYVQPNGHIWAWLKVHIPACPAQPTYQAAYLYQSHMTPISSLAIEYVHCRAGIIINGRIQGPMPKSVHQAAYTSIPQPASATMYLSRH